MFSESLSRGRGLARQNSSFVSLHQGAKPDKIVLHARTWKNMFSESLSLGLSEPTPRRSDRKYPPPGLVSPLPPPSPAGRLPQILRDRRCPGRAGPNPPQQRRAFPVSPAGRQSVHSPPVRSVPSQHARAPERPRGRPGGPSRSQGWWGAPPSPHRMVANTPTSGGPCNDHPPGRRAFHQAQERLRSPTAVPHGHPEVAAGQAAHPTPERRRAAPP